MTTLSFTIPDDKIAKALEGFLKIYPNNEKNLDGTPKYTDSAWVREKIRQIIVRNIHRGLEMIARDNSVVIIDNNVII